jgi:Tol biopolymer transport system component
MTKMSAVVRVSHQQERRFLIARSRPAASCAQRGEAAGNVVLKQQRIIAPGAIKHCIGAFAACCALSWAQGVTAASGWDITDTGQPHEDVQFPLTEGTWMSVDVSPDDRTLVFDLLGDIYSLPAAGGEAKLVHGGPAMQHAATFSPDGRSLLYLSDASGADNLWISNIDGSDARQITHETVDMLMGPTWGADGKTVAASKIYANFPHMHASEIRWFDLSGGNGRVLVEPPKNGRDVQESRFSPDGRSIYYTQRLTDPVIYVDGNHINYGIMRRDLQTGATEQILSGFGSATTAQISRDGKQLAFVRRVKAKTVLFVYDTATRAQRPVYDDLDRDDMTDFVPQGVYYPAFGWFADNRHIAIWGKGKLFNVDTVSGEHHEIPFRAEAKVRIIQPLRVENELKVRVVKHLALSPDGRTLIFDSLGHLWRKTMPDGAPSRLTSARAFEFEAAWSADGRRIAYVEWDDETGSTLKVAAADGRGGKAVAGSRGVIRQPAFSHDGKQLVYRIQDPDKSMGGYRAKAGVYTVDLSGGAHTRGTKSGDGRYVSSGDASPFFSPDDSRIYYTKVDNSGDSTVHRLQSVTRDGHDVRVHAQTPDADTLDLTISPDLKWLAFRDRQQYYVTPYRETGAALTVSAQSSAAPVAQLTDTGGYALTWSADSSTLHWALGPDLYKANVSAQFEQGWSLPRSYAAIGLEVAADVPQGTVAFTNGRVITMRGDEVIEHGTVVVTGNRIAAVGPAADVPIPAGAKVIDVAGKFVMPGLIDMHGHIDCCYETGVTPQKQFTRYAALAFGVTTNFDPYSTELPQYESNETNLAGLTVSPRWLGSGHVIYGRAQKSDFNYVPISSIDDARRVMARKKAIGGLYVKSYKQPARSQRQQLVKAGREAGIMVDVEGESHFYYNITMLMDGHTNLEHNIPVANYYDDIVQLMSRAHASNTPTLIVNFGELMGENFMYQNTRAWEDPKVRKYVQETISYYSPLGAISGAPLWVRGMTSINAADEIYDIGFRSMSRSVKKLDDAGVIINVGSHGQVPGLAMHWEMQLMSQGGMSNAHILRAATLNGARTLALDKQLGSLEPGKLADVIVLDKDPLDDIRNTNSVRYTMVNGRVYDSLSMNEIGNYDRPRSRFYWELTDYHGIDWNEAWSAP